MNTKKKRARQTTEHFQKYDSAWKDVIQELLEPFMRFFFPDIHADIDFSKGIEFLGQELRKIFPDGNMGKRYADELIKVHLTDGSAKYIRVFIHLEIQRAPEANLGERVFVYFYRIFDRYREKGTEVVSLVVLADENENYRPDEFRSKSWGFDLRMKFPIIKLIDYKTKKELREILETSDNPMAMVVKAQLRSFELQKADDIKKSTVKWELIRECYEKGYEKKAIWTLFKFIDWLIRLPVDLEEQLSKKIVKLEEESKMPYVTSWERMAEERGETRGEKRGETRGEKKANIETARRMLNEGFSIETISRCTQLSESEIKKLMH